MLGRLHYIQLFSSYFCCTWLITTNIYYFTVPADLNLGVAKLSDSGSWTLFGYNIDTDKGWSYVKAWLGWRICSQIHSHGCFQKLSVPHWLLAGSLSYSQHGPLSKLLSVLTTWQLPFPSEQSQREQEESWHIYSLHLEVTSQHFYILFMRTSH